MIGYNCAPIKLYENRELVVLTCGFLASFDIVDPSGFVNLKLRHCRAETVLQWFEEVEPLKNS